MKGCVLSVIKYERIHKLQAAITRAKQQKTTRHANIAESVRPTATIKDI